MALEICFFSVFPVDAFFTWKIETKLRGNLRLCRTFLRELEYLDHNPQTVIIIIIILYCAAMS